MQFYPPVSGYPIGGPSFPCNNFAAAAPWAWGRVVGEGDVAAVALAGGGVQLYFVPAPAPAPAPYCPPYAAPAWNSYPEAWFIRSVPTSFPPCQQSVSNPQAHRVTSDPSFQQISAENKASFHLKFHNDGCTSTTDIHCFYPSLRCHNWFPKQSVATQAHPCSPEPRLPCFRPSYCTNNSIGTKTSKVNKNVSCACKETDVSACNESKSSNGSNMSVEVQNCIMEIDKQLEGKNSKHKKACKKGGKSNHECECPPEKSSKACATVTEQATSCETCRETQAPCAACEPCGPCGPCGQGAPVRRVSSLLINDAEVDFWYPKTPYSRKDMDTKASAGSCSCGCAAASDSDAPSNN